jgi:hypothetical protein
VKAKPPCPGTVDGPPGKNKDEGGDRPCGKDKTKGGVVIVLPLALAAVAGGLKRRADDSLRRRRRKR